MTIGHDTKLTQADTVDRTLASDHQNAQIITASNLGNILVTDVNEVRRFHETVQSSSTIGMPSTKTYQVRKQKLANPDSGRLSVPKPRKKGIFTMMDSAHSTSNFEVEEECSGSLDDLDNIQILLKNLKDKKHNGCLSPLDRQLLKKI